jgi:hypothetical protein
MRKMQLLGNSVKKTQRKHQNIDVCSRANHLTDCLRVQFDLQFEKLAREPKIISAYEPFVAVVSVFTAFNFLNGKTLRLEIENSRDVTFFVAEKVKKVGSGIFLKTKYRFKSTRKCTTCDILHQN